MGNDLFFLLGNAHDKPTRGDLHCYNGWYPRSNQYLRDLGYSPKFHTQDDLRELIQTTLDEIVPDTPNRQMKEIFDAISIIADLASRLADSDDSTGIWTVYD